MSSMFETVTFDSCLGFRILAPGEPRDVAITLSWKTGRAPGRALFTVTC